MISCTHGHFQVLGFSRYLLLCISTPPLAVGEVPFGIPMASSVLRLILWPAHGLPGRAACTFQANVYPAATVGSVQGLLWLSLGHWVGPGQDLLPSPWILSVDCLTTCAPGGSVAGHKEKAAPTATVNSLVTPDRMWGSLWLPLFSLLLGLEGRLESSCASLQLSQWVVRALQWPGLLSVGGV